MPRVFLKARTWFKSDVALKPSIKFQVSCFKRKQRRQYFITKLGRHQITQAQLEKATARLHANIAIKIAVHDQD